jgi:hypothetical protein
MKTIDFNDPFLRKNYDPSMESLYNMENHLSYIEDIKKNIPFYGKECIERELKKKHASYKSQDKKKNRYDVNKHIQYMELIDKLWESGLHCYYCNNTICLIYKNKNETNQWSLERFDNNIGHYSTNTCITCLKCNLQRRNENHEYFKYGKQLKIVKY